MKTYFDTPEADMQLSKYVKNRKGFSLFEYHYSFMSTNVTIDHTKKRIIRLMIFYAELILKLCLAFQRLFIVIGNNYRFNGRKNGR